MIHELWPPKVGPPKMFKIMSKMYLADFICILRVFQLQVLSLSVQNLLGGHKVAYLRKAHTLSRISLGDSSQLYLTDCCNEGAHLGAHIVILKFQNFASAVIIESQYLSRNMLVFLCFYYKFMVLMVAPFIKWYLSISF